MYERSFRTGVGAGNRARPLLSVLITALLVLILAGAGGEAGRGATEDGPIQVLDISYSINFGREIEFTLAARSDAADITEIRAFFTPQGAGTVSSYAYLDFQPDDDVLARFSIPTNGRGSYYPPGTQFYIYYEITDEAGNELRTDRMTLEYLDPRFDWKRSTRAGLTVLYHDRREADIDRLLDAAERNLPLMEQTLGIETDGGYRAVLINSRSEADLSFPFVSEAASEQHAFVGFAFDRHELFVLLGNNRGSFVHELAHLLFSEAVSSPLARPPAWLNEGLSVYFEENGQPGGERRLRQLSAGDRLLPLRSMNRVPGDLRLVEGFYAKAGNFVGFLVDRFGPERMASLLAEMDEGTPTRGAFESVYGSSLDEMDAQWTAQLLGEPVISAITPQPPAPDAEVSLASQPTTAPPQSAEAPPVVPLPVPATGRDTRGLLLGGVLALLSVGVAISFLRRRLWAGRRGGT